MKSWWMAALAVVLATTLTPSISEAKRLGGGKSTGMQRDMPARTAPDAAPAKPAAPTQAAAPATAGAAAAAAAPGKRSWMGPLAGLAAGLGLAALASHLGFGDELASFMLMALAAVAVIALIAFIRRRMAGGTAARKPALAAAGAGGMPPTQVAWPAPAAPNTTAREALAPVADTAAAPAAASASAPVAAAFVPASFDADSFERIAKMIFIRMQAANDAANLDDLRQFTTPEMFASIKMDLLDRGPAAQATEVTRVEAKVIDVAEEADRQVVSVRYQGEAVEAAGAAPAAFDEVWHLVKARADGSQWAIAGIEQMV